MPIFKVQTIYVEAFRLPLPKAHSLEGNAMSEELLQFLHKGTDIEIYYDGAVRVHPGPDGGRLACPGDWVLRTKDGGLTSMSDYEFNDTYKEELNGGHKERRG